MTRPVKGFLTKRGRYFDKKIDAQVCDAIEDFDEGLKDYLEQYYMPPIVQEFIMSHMKYFLVANREISEPYIKLVTELPTEPVKLEQMAPIATGAVIVDPPAFNMPEDVHDFLPELEDETPAIDDATDFANAFVDPDGSGGGEPDNDADVRHAGVPGEDPTE